MRHLLYVFVLAFGMAASAQTLPLQNLDTDDFYHLVGDFSAAAHHSSVSGAGTLGHVWGFEAGLVVSTTNTPELNRIVHETDPSANASRVPSGELLGAVTIPFALTVELGLIPKVGSDTFKFSSTHLALKWTFSELLELPVDLAAKAFLTRANLDFDSTVSGVDTHFAFEDRMTGVQLIITKDLGLLAPYFALGTVNARGELNVTGSGTVFSDAGYAAAQSASATRRSGHWALGSEFRLGILKLGVEYARLYGTGRFSSKVAVFF